MIFLKKKTSWKVGENEVALYPYLFPTHPTHIRILEPELLVTVVVVVGGGGGGGERCEKGTA